MLIYLQDSEHGLIDDNNMYAKVTVESAAPVKVDNSLFIQYVNNKIQGNMPSTIIKSLTKLESLLLSENKFLKSVKVLAKALRGKKIKELYLNNCNLTSKNAAKIIKSLPDEIENIESAESATAK